MIHITAPFRFLRSMALALWDRLRGKPFFAPSEVVERRLDTCAACEHNVNGRCKICACFIAAKTVVAREACPDGRWKRV